MHIENTQFTFDPKHKKWATILVGIGVLSLIYGIFMCGGTRVWANVLTSGWYFTAIALTSVFWIAVNNVAHSGWPTAFKRVPEAMGSYLVVGAIVMLLIVLGIIMHWHHLYHWSHEGIMDPTSENYDEIIAHKKPFLNNMFYFIRYVVYFTFWILLYTILRKLSLKEDEEGGVTHFKKSLVFSAFFVIFFGITSSTSAWDFIMSIDTHWFSTLFGWYNFISMFVACLCVMTLIIIYLKNQGYLSMVSENHLHDLGKFIFAFTIFWGYLWFSQFMLIWYANIPEETIYFYQRFEHYKALFFINLIINFFIPFLVLMDRDVKRKMRTLTVVCINLIVGHWLDFYIMIMPGTVGENYGIGILEIGLLLGFAGLFALTVAKALSKASLAPKNHPYLEESLHHHV